MYPLQGYLKGKNEEPCLGIELTIGSEAGTEQYYGLISHEAIQKTVEMLEALRNGTLQEDRCVCLIDDYRLEISIEASADNKQHPCAVSVVKKYTGRSYLSYDIDDFFAPAEEKPFQYKTPAENPESSYAKEEFRPELRLVPEREVFELENSQMENILASFRDGLGCVDWSQYGKQQLYRFHFPRKKPVGFGTITETNWSISQLIQGHRIERIFFSMTCMYDMHYWENFLEGTLYDLDGQKPWELVMEFDHGFLEMVPWRGSTILLTFFSRDEVICDDYPDDMDGDFGCPQYYETKGPAADSVCDRTVESVQAIDSREYYQSEPDQRWGGSTDWIYQNYREPTTLIFRLSNSLELGVVSDESEECRLQVQPLKPALRIL